MIKPFLIGAVGSLLAGGMGWAQQASEERSLFEPIESGPVRAAAAIAAESMAGRCAAGVMPRPEHADDETGGWRDWGGDGNVRFQPQDRGGVSAELLPRLELDWAFAFPDAGAVSTQATVAGPMVFVAANTGFVYALSAASGCMHWAFEADAEVRGAIALGTVSARGEAAAQPRPLIFFGDRRANAYAVDAATGELAWRTRLDEHSAARVTGAPAFHEGRVYVPVSSSEEGAGGNPNYECCTFRGSVVALDAASGERQWKTYAIPEEPQPVRHNSVGTQMWAPSGAAIWSPPTIDAARGVLYVATGNAYSEPAADNINSVLAIELESGRIRWAVNASSDDVWLAACMASNTAPNCPEELGPDHDFGAPPILARLTDGREVLIAGQKSGNVWAYDPDRQGALLWRTPLVADTTQFGGKIIWGGAFDGERVFFGLGTGGIAGVQAKDGHLDWFTALEPAPALARHVGQDGPVSAVPGAVLSGGWDGVLRALAVDDGRILWEFDTVRPYETVNGVAGRGGSMGALGPTVAGGRIFVPSGYVGVKSGMQGNVLLAFSLRPE